MNHILLNIILLIFSFSLNILSMYLAKYIAEKKMYNPYDSLPDIIQNNIIETNNHLPDYLLLVTIFIFFIKIFYYNLNLYNLYLNLYSLNFSLLLRSITISITILPSSMPIQFFNNNNIYEVLFNNSHDLMFSGHTIFFTFLAKLILNNHNNRMLYYSGNIIQYIFPLSLITSRQHYSIDVLIAMIIYRYFMFNVKYYKLI